MSNDMKKIKRKNMDYLKYDLDEIFTIDDFKNQTDEVFHKLVSKQIDKAMILKDSKSKFVMLHLSDYENLIKNIDTRQKSKNDKTNIQENNISSNKTTNLQTVKENVSKFEELKSSVSDDSKADDEIGEDELQKALEAIEKINIIEDKASTVLDKDKADKIKDKSKISIPKIKDKEKRAKEAFWE